MTTCYEESMTQEIKAFVNTEVLCSDMHEQGGPSIPRKHQEDYECHIMFFVSGTYIAKDTLPE